MRILIVNWAPLSEGASVGGGVNGYCHSLALELVAAGHEVVHLSSGRVYTRDTRPLLPDENPDRPGPCEVRSLPDYRGVHVYEVVNSPVLAPSFFQFRDPFTEMSAPRLEREIERFFSILSPDVVHVHNLEGLSAGCVRAIRAATARRPAAVLFSLHNYHTVCPQVNLMRAEKHPCLDFENGHLCGSCIATPDPRHERTRRVFNACEPPRTTELSVRGTPVKPAIASDGSAEAVHRSFGTDPRDYDSPEYRPLENEVPSPTPNPRPPNIYGRRRAAMVGVLNSCDRVLAVSGFVERLFGSMGVESRVLRRLAIGTRMAEMGADCRVERASTPARAADRPIRLVFLGYNLPFKGLPMLMDALELLTPETLSRISLGAFGTGVPDLRDRAAPLQGALAHLELGGAYAYEDIPGILRSADAGVVPSVWWDTGPQTVMEFLSCGVPVLGAQLGGIPDFVRHGVNGLLFRGNDRFDLARTIASLVQNPATLDTIRAGVAPPKTMRDHAAELQEHYAECLAARRAPARPR